MWISVVHTVCRWRLSRVVLEILAEKGLVREIELVGYLLNAQRRIFQQVLRLEYDETVYPVGSRAAVVRYLGVRFNSSA